MGGFIPEDEDPRPAALGRGRGSASGPPVQARPVNVARAPQQHSQGHHILRNPSPGAAANQRNRCGECATGIPCGDLHAVFGIQVCSSCRKQLSFVSKTTAKQQYLLTDADLKLLKSMERKNPQHADWTAMKLYLERQVQEISYKKYGGQEGLEEEARRRVSKKLDKRIQQRESKVKEEARRVKRVREIREGIKGGNGADDAYRAAQVDEEII